MSVELNKVSENIECNICSKAIKNPIKLHCGHTFCYICIKAWWDKGPQDSLEHTCPMDRTLFSIIEVQKVFKELPVGSEFSKLMKTYDIYHNASGGR